MDHSSMNSYYYNRTTIDATIIFFHKTINNQQQFNLKLLVTRIFISRRYFDQNYIYNLLYYYIIFNTNLNRITGNL